jgi:hypothetical protein
MKLILSSFVILLTIGAAAMGQLVGSGVAHYFAVKPDGQLVVIDGRVCCWRSQEADKDPRKAWYPKLPELPAALNATWLESVEGVSPQRSGKNDRDEHYLQLRRSGGNRKDTIYLAIDNKGRAIAVSQLMDSFLWRAIEDAGGWQASRTDPADVVQVFRFRAVARAEKDGFLGLAEKPITAKDSSGKDEEFFPLIITDEEHAAHFAYNDYSGK